ncbi:deoxyuridine 5'-triphosphate nucleotidohydrolase [Candidatus Vecturithrix granuli]|uniref:Deoxyuridine 5'-triphosphate nucleotidohydrolase n=1 Tax=Vecturithrix granuli TaxID=1499967 RepID=A0A081C4D6_VECG1|nr:deoxyuridine 5'-triphosphate nucleotidohydrolase [Candidatus Vecturithrix granuli]
MEVRVIKIHEDAILPHYSYPGDSGMDLYSIEDVIIPPGDTQLVRTGLKIAVPDRYEAQVRPKSGLALQHAVTVTNTPGTVDSGYRGEICVILINHGREAYHVQKHAKIAQLVICPVVRAKIIEVEQLDETSRGNSGFGSTGLTHLV